MFGLYPASCEPTQSMIPSPRTYSPTDHGPPSQGPRPGVTPKPSSTDYPS